jgi:hypothetical protein
MENRMPFQKFMRVVVLVIGLALLVVTCIGAARGWNSTGLEILGILGAVCLLMALAVDRLTQIIFKRGKTEIGFTLADSLDAKVTKDLAVTGLAGAAGTYSFIHNQLVGTDENLKRVKVQLQDQVVKMVQKNAFDHKVDGPQVDKVLSTGSPAERVLIFGLLQTNGQLATVERLREGILHSESGNEQYHALLATFEQFDKFPSDEQKQLREYVQTAVQANSWIKNDADRRKLADQILAT